jgi:hypothetical protein
VSAGDLALVVVTVAALVAVAGTLAATVALVRSVRSVRRSLAQLEEDLAATRHAVVIADAEVRRVDDALMSAEELTAELASSTSLVRRLAVRPLVRIAAVVRGVGRSVASVGRRGDGSRRGRRRASRRQRRSDLAGGGRRGRGLAA